MSAPLAAHGPDVAAAIPALAIEHVSHAYGPRLALDDVSFAVRQGAFTALLGLNGAGKSSLFALITRLYPVQRGAIRVFGHDILRSPGPALRRLGVVFQPRTLDLDLSVMQNLVYHAALHGIARRDALARAHDALDRIGLADRADSKARELSGGQMRRVEVARAMLHRPRLLLLDEPTVGLDVKARSAILAHVRALVARGETSVLWATHLFDEISSSDDLVLLHQGRMLAHGVAAEVITAAGEADLRGAFLRLTGAQEEDT